MKNKPIPIYFILTLSIYIASTVLLKQFTTPDIGFIVLVFISIYLGPLYATLLGFICGLSIDVLSISPLGFHAAVFVTMGYIYGKLKGKIFVDPIIVPIIIIAVALLLKTGLGYILLLFIRDNETVSFFYYDFWKQFFFSCLAAPFLYFALRSVNLINLNEKD